MTFASISRRRLALGTAATATAALIAGCGSSNNDTASSTTAKPASSGMSGMSGMDHSTGGASSTANAMPGMTPLVSGADGTTASVAGLTLKPMSTTIPAPGSTWRFHIASANGSPITKFQRDQTKLLHLIVASKDLSSYQHLHPTLSPSGTFSIPLKLAKPGAYRAIGDFTTTAGKRYALGVTLTVPGTAAQSPLPPATKTATTDGYTVTLDDGALPAATETAVSFTITKAGKPVTDLQPYLGAFGHLVALRQGDLAYSHIHPTSDDRTNGEIQFSAELPTAATYRLFLQFRTGGTVHTAAFTAAATP